MRIIMYILAALSAIGAIVSWVWTVVEFIIFIAKDYKFNWWSLLTFIICVVFFALFLIISLILKVEKTDKQAEEAAFGKQPSKYKSVFEARLEAMAKQRNKKMQTYD